MELAFEFRSVNGIFGEVVYCCVKLVGHMWPIQFLSYSIVHETLARVSWQFCMILNVEEALSNGELTPSCALHRRLGQCPPTCVDGRRSNNILVS